MRTLITESALLRRTEPPPRIIASTDRLEWASMQSVILQEIPHHHVYDGGSNLWLSTVPERPTDIVSTLAGSRKHGPLAPGSICLNYKHGEATVALDSHVEVHHTYVRPHVVEEVASTLFKGDARKIELIPIFGVDDPITSMLLASVRHSMAMPDGHVGQLYSDYVARALVAHLLRSFSTRQDLALPRTSVGRFNTWKINDLTSYMRENIARDIGIQELAAITHYAPTHFARVFKVTFNCTPYQYLAHMRIQHARELLSATMLPIASVGAACGFPSHAHFSSVFRRYVGLTPAAYRGARTSVRIVEP
jgi:Transcriptional regulator containing an amidase domain and an AraC-type DNA-binding HTH domain